MNLGIENIEGTNFAFTVVTGVVHGLVRYNRMEVSGGDGSGAMINSYGAASARGISSENYNDMEFCLHTDDGEERPVTLRKSLLPLVENQRLSIIYAHRPINPKNVAVAGFINHSAKSYWVGEIDKMISMTLKYGAGHWHKGILLLLLLLGVTLGGSIMLHSNNFFIYGLAATLAYAIYGGMIMPEIALNKVGVKLGEVLEKVMTQLLDAKEAQ